MQLNWGGTNAETLRTPNAFGAEYSCFGYDHRTSVASSTLRFSAAFASLRFSPGFSTAFVRLRVVSFTHRPRRRPRRRIPIEKSRTRTRRKDELTLRFQSASYNPRTPTICCVSTHHTLRLRQRKISIGCNDVVLGACNSGIERMTSGRR